MNERELSNGIAEFLIEVSQSLPEPQTQADGGAAFVGRGGRPPVLVATDFGDRENNPNPDARDWAGRLMAYWVTPAPIEDMEEIDRERNAGKSQEARLASALWGDPTAANKLVTEWTAAMDEILKNSHLSDPGKRFLSIMFHDATVGGRATVEIIDFEKLKIDPVLMFTGLVDHARYVDITLFDFHDRLIKTAEEQLAGKEEAEIDSYWTIDKEFLEEQKDLHDKWEQALSERPEGK